RSRALRVSRRASPFHIAREAFGEIRWRASVWVHSRKQDMGIAIETAGLTRHFGNFCAVNGIDLRVESGRFYGFLGPNGAGKSTTIKMLTGLLAPTSGSMSILGQ